MTEGDWTLVLFALGLICLVQSIRLQLSDGAGRRVVDNPKPQTRAPVGPRPPPPPPPPRKRAPVCCHVHSTRWGKPRKR